MLRLTIRSLRDQRSRFVSWIEMVLPSLLFHVFYKGLSRRAKLTPAKPLSG